MAFEIERKFRVRDASWRNGSTGQRMAQGYLSRDPDRTVRVRLAGDQAWLTIKGRNEGIRRSEFEFAIPVAEARGLLDLCLHGVIEKTRHRIPHGGHLWEVDEFHGANAGLVIAEVEIADESVIPLPPPWLGAEVSDDPRYFNSSLAVHPFSEWGGES